MSVTFTSGTRTLVLRDPDFNDEDRFNPRAVNRLSRGGDRVVWDIGRRPVRVLSWQFTWLTERGRRAAIQFFADTAGKPLTLTDHYGAVRTVVLTNPEAGVNTPGVVGSAMSIEMDVLSAPDQ